MGVAGRRGGCFILGTACARVRLVTRWNRLSAYQNGKVANDHGERFARGAARGLSAVRRRVGSGDGDDPRFAIELPAGWLVLREFVVSPSARRAEGGAAIGRVAARLAVRDVRLRRRGGTWGRCLDAGAEVFRSALIGRGRMSFLVSLDFKKSALDGTSVALPQNLEKPLQWPASRDLVTLLSQFCWRRAYWPISFCQ